MPCGACFLFKRLLREAPLRMMLNGPGSNGTSRDYGLKKLFDLEDRLRLRLRPVLRQVNRKLRPSEFRKMLEKARAV